MYPLPLYRPNPPPPPPPTPTTPIEQISPHCQYNNQDLTQQKLAHQKDSTQLSAYHQSERKYRKKNDCLLQMLLFQSALNGEGARRFRCGRAQSTCLDSMPPFPFVTPGTQVFLVLLLFKAEAVSHGKNQHLLCKKINFCHLLFHNRQ